MAMWLAVRRSPILLAGTLAIATALSLLSSCSAAKNDEPKPNIIEYTVRGEIKQLPAAQSPVAELVVRHEPVPSYMMGNDVVGMKSMQMPFPLAPGVSLTGLSVGDPIEMTFGVEYNESGSPVNLQVVSVTPLPKDTLLHFE